jgi:hypothetical protein
VSKTKLPAICKRCEKINSRDCLRCKEIKKLLRPNEKKHDILHHDIRKSLVTAETDLAKTAIEEATARKAALAVAEEDDIGMQLVEDEEENTNTTELAKATRSHVSADEVKKKFKDKHIFREHEDFLLKLFCKFVDCWSITKVSKASKCSKPNLQKKIKLRINKFMGLSKKNPSTKMITPDKFKKTLYL